MADPAMAAHGLVKRFGPVVALDGIDLAVQAGSVLGLLGPNGAGKTTAVRILTTILKPDAGQANPSGRADLWSLIGELVADGTTVLLTTQYLEEADRLATHIVVIDSGRIIAEGTPVELKARLGSIVVEIRVVDPADARRAAARLQRIAPAGVLGSGDTLAVKVPDKGPAVQQVIRLLDADAIVAESLAIREPTLDDVFLQLTGHLAGTRPDEPAPQTADAGRVDQGSTHDHAQRTS
jgi:ABC-2 type transport system ATP-binding protein